MPSVATHSQILKQRKLLAETIVGHLVGAEIPFAEGLEVLLLAKATYRLRVAANTQPSDSDLEAWRKRRAEAGPVGNSKKSLELRTELERTKKSSRRQ